MSTAHDKGLELFKNLHGGHSGEEIVRAFEKLSPKMLLMTLEWIFGGSNATENPRPENQRMNHPLSL